MNINKKIIAPFLLITVLIFGGWGQTGHKIINQNVTISFPPQMNEFLYWSSILAQHASDADNRKGSDPTEAPKHFIDIDSYPEFVANHKINESYDSNVAMHGSSFVTNEGILPWAIIAAYDTLKNCFTRRDWNKAVLIAADLGHYIADSHQPLHITKNYNPNGVHSRYETDMIDRYQSQITYTPGTAIYITNIPDFVFTSIYNNYIYVDSVINADGIAKTFAGNTSSDFYYQKLWGLTGNFTISLFKKASTNIASLIYTAWTDAGSPLPSGGFLPVELEAFNAKVSQNSISLNWVTATELNNSGFDIERSTDDKKFQKLSFVKGKGSSTETTKYFYTDSALDNGYYFYRLRQIDFSGTSKYSNVVEVNVSIAPNGFKLSQNYPNPFNPSTIINYSVPSKSFVTIKVYDVLGKEVATLVNGEKAAGNYQIVFNADKLASSVYLCIMNAGNAVITRKLILSK